MRTNTTKKVIDKAKRASEFKESFASCPNYGLKESYFETDGQNSSLFDRDCEKITMYFSSKWHPRESRDEYEQTFSTTTTIKEEWSSVSCQLSIGTNYRHYTYYKKIRNVYGESIT